MRAYINYSSIIGKTIAIIRQNCGLEQKDLAVGMGINQSSLSRIERGITTLSIKQLYKVAGCLKISPSKIVIIADQVSEILSSEDIFVGCDDFDESKSPVRIELQFLNKKILECLEKDNHIS